MAGTALAAGIVTPSGARAAPDADGPRADEMRAGGPPGEGSPPPYPLHALFAATSATPGPAELLAARRFAEAIAERRLPPVETVVVAPPAAARAPGLVERAREAAAGLRFDEGARLLDEALAELETGGGAGLDQRELVELFLLHGWMAEKSAWIGATAAAAAPSTPVARQAYLRAATLDPAHVPDPGRFPPPVVAGFVWAADEVARRPSGALVVRAPSGATVSIDGRPPLLAPASLPALAFGEHFVRVTMPGRRPWSARVPLAEPTLVIDAPPLAPLVVEPARAARHARDAGAAFALLAEPRERALALTLIDTGDPSQQIGAMVSLAPAEDDPLDAALIRLAATARRRHLQARASRIGRASPLVFAAAPALPPRPGPVLAEDPAAWARARWPLLTALATAAASAVVLGVVVANGDGMKVR